MRDEIQLLQFLICKEFLEGKQDSYTAELVHSNIYVPSFPCYLGAIYAVTCWRKDKRFHKEIIEYSTDYGTAAKSPHMDIEPVTDSVIFRWHKHPFPVDFAIEKPTTLTIRVILDWKTVFESYILIEKLS
ncbi:MAG: hypothetical protein HY447_03520 [Candidatus Omnitrophica bacterium]|nr:hypothetical protein [Candidatus Omnitrophota bacterium]